MRAESPTSSGRSVCSSRRCGGVGMAPTSPTPCLVGGGQGADPQGSVEGERSTDLPGLSVIEPTPSREPSANGTVFIASHSQFA